MKPYLKYIFKNIWRQKKEVFIWIPLMLLEIASRIVQPYFYKFVVDILTVGISANNFTNAEVKSLIFVVMLWFFSAVVFNIVHGFEEAVVWKIGSCSSQWGVMAGYKKLLELDYYKHTLKHSSRYAKIIDDADSDTWEMTNWWLGRFIKGGIGFFLMLAVAFSISWQMALIAVAIVPVGLAHIIFLVNKFDGMQRNVNKLWEKKHEHLSDQITNIITYKLNQKQDLYLKVHKDGYGYKAHNAQQALNKKWAMTDMLNPDVFARFLVMALGIYWVKTGTITLGTLFMFMGLTSEILAPLHLLSDILPQYSRRARHIDKYLKLLDEQDKVLDPTKPLKTSDDLLAKSKGKIEFKNVDFAYSENGRQIINDLSFEIEPGQHVAIVGHSGAGKSTIMALVTRLVDPINGEILFDGINLRDLKQEDYRALLGVVLQENSLYNETVGQNIAYGKPEATLEEIDNAAKLAAADDFISKLPDSYETLIGERGVKLSGGEKQRLAIARAILKNPKVVVLDEPTSALDSITEAKVQKGLDTLIEGRTAIVIAHRLATVRNADKILVLSEGKKIAFGSHSELMRTCEDYQRMVELQTGGFLADK